jgi:hypothetical protein
MIRARTAAAAPVPVRGPRGLRALAAGLAVVMAAGAAAAQPVPLMCIGTSPMFALSVTGAEVRFDYLGDGTFRLDPPLTVPRVVYQRFTLVTRRQAWPVVLEERTCRIRSLEFPMRIELRAPSNGATRSFFGCCLWADGDG